MENRTQELEGTLLADRFELLHEVGRGRIGVVFRARDLRLDRPVAVKVLYQTVSDEDISYARFEREARSTGCLAHPNIVSVLDFGLSADSFPYLVMEYLEGMNLHDLITTETRVPVERAVRIMVQLCSALGHAHNRGVVHRDLKPSNIMLLNLEGLPDFAKIVDFGIAMRFEANEDTLERLTMEGQVLGTPAYMSPEQCQAKNLDVRSDVYSLGCVFFKMLTGAAPFAGTGFLEIMQAHMYRTPLRFEEFDGGKDVPLDLQNIIYQSLSKQPDDRQQSMAEMNFQLHDVLTSLTAAGSVATRSSLPAAKAKASSSAAPAAGMPETQALDELLQKASAGDRDARYLLSLRYEFGDGTLTNKSEAARWLHAAAEQGHAEAQFKLSRQLLSPEGSGGNSIEDSLTWLKRSAEQGYEPAQFNLAACYETGDGIPMDTVEAVKWYRRACLQGNRQAEPHLIACYRICMDLGLLHAEGFLDWAAERAAEGDANALYIMACHFRPNGPGSGNPVEYMQFLTRAADQGHSKAYVELARLLIERKDAAAYYSDAFAMLNKAAQANNMEANALLASCYKIGMGTAQDPVKALQLLQLASDNNDPDAQVLMASAMLVGDGIPRNITRAIALLRNAASLGNCCAQWKLALCAKNGMGMMRDTREAENWFIKSAEGRFHQGLPWKPPVPGLLFEEAFQTFQSLANLDHKQSYYWLGICFEDGLIAQQDWSRALEYYTRAANKGLEHAAHAANRLRNQMRSAAMR